MRGTAYKTYVEDKNIAKTYDTPKRDISNPMT